MVKIIYSSIISLILFIIEIDYYIYFHLRCLGITLINNLIKTETPKILVLLIK